MIKSLPKMLVATRNSGKLRELNSLLSDRGFDLTSLDEVGIEELVEEDGTTFEENAVKKAVSYSKISGLTTLSDDSGLEVDGLNGSPGVLSSRYAGVGSDDNDNVQLLLSNLSHISKSNWTARFRCVIVIARMGFTPLIHTGICEGRIIDKPTGSKGFGYDPVFLVEQFGKTMAQLSLKEKNQISHRGIAINKLISNLGIVSEWHKGFRSSRGK